MAKIDFQLGMTMHIGQPSNNEYIKMTLGVSDFDTELDFAEQITKVHTTAHQVMSWMEDQMGGKMAEQLQK